MGPRLFIFLIDEVGSGSEWPLRQSAADAEGGGLAEWLWQC